MERIVVNEGGSGNTAGESGQSYADVDSGTMSERLYFHIMMILVSNILILCDSTIIIVYPNIILHYMIRYDTT